MNASRNRSQRLWKVLGSAVVVWLLASFPIAGATVAQDATPMASPGAAGISSEPFGEADGQPVDLYTLTNANGMEVKIMTYGGIIQSIRVPDRDGTMANVTLGYATLDEYLAAGNPSYFGCITGRYANRIARGTFVLGDQTYRLALNNGENSLHGGKKGFDKQVWAAEEVTGGDGVGLKLSRTSPDGEEGYPGNLAVDVTFTLTDNNELKFDYHATTDKTTVLNLTNHSYWNLAGDGVGSTNDHQLQLMASNYTPVERDPDPDRRDRSRRGNAARLHDAARDRRARPRQLRAVGARSRLRPQLRARPSEPGRHDHDAGGSSCRTDERQDTGDLHDRAGHSVLLRELPRRDVDRRRGKDVSPGRRLRAGDATLS